MKGLPDLVPVQALVWTQNGQCALMPSSDMPRAPNVSLISFTDLNPFGPFSM